MPDLRPKWDTIVRPDLRVGPMAVAARDGACGCGVEVLEHEPIIAVGAYVVAEPDGSPGTVDLTGSEWRCQRCAHGAVATDG